MTNDDKKDLIKLVQKMKNQKQRTINDLDKRIEELEKQKKYLIKQIQICDTWLKIQKIQKNEPIIIEY